MELRPSDVAIRIFNPLGIWGFSSGLKQQWRKTDRSLLASAKDYNVALHIHPLNFLMAY
jgi:hypothetical protein